jgi:23S rRNA-/tRNA-specific pseudouridylate synthase
MNKIRLHKLVWEKIKAQNLEWTQPEVARNIQNYGIWVDGNLIKNRLAWITDLEKIYFSHWPQRQQTDFSDLKVLHQDADLLAVFKTSGMVVEPGNGHLKDNLISFLNQNGGEFSAIHRLDKETSGILLIAKNPTSLDFFQKQFKERLVVKKYLAILNGKLDKTIQINNFQTRNPANPILQKLVWQVPSDQDLENYRESSSIFKPLVYSLQENLTLSEIEIFTGRMHQIRLQAQILGLAVVGDTKYSQKPDLSLENLLQKPELKGKNLEIINFNPVIKICEQGSDFTEYLDIFGSSSLKLLSNYLKIKTTTGEVLELQVVDLH